MVSISSRFISISITEILLKLSEIDSYEKMKIVIGPEPWLVPGPESRDFLALKASIGLGNSELKTSPRLGSYTPVP